MTHPPHEHGDQPSVGDLLRNYRRRAGHTQQEAAALAGLSVAALRDVEQGRVRAPRPATLRRLADALALTPAEAEELVRANQVVAPPGIRLNVLGPLVVLVDGAPVDLGSDLQRTLLGLLALSPNVPVGREALVEAGWGGAPPARATSMLQTQISRLRHRLRPRSRPASGLLAATPGGYRLTVTDDQLDLLEFTRLAEAARARPDPTGAGELFDLALRLWRDDPLVDVPRLQAHPAVAELTDRWRAVVLDRARLAADPETYARVLPALERATRADPFHEAAHAQLMIALAGTGRQAAALGVFDAVRRRFGEELGVAPGPELRRAHVRVLRQEVGRSPTAPLHAHRQLPPDIADFTGRRTELATLRAAAPTGTWCVQGMPGVGKTRLAVHVAHQLVADGAYPDLQLYVDLHGHSARSPVDPSATLGSLLGLLGIEASRVPPDLAARSALYRDQLAGRRALVVLDNAASADQVRPLLPPAGSLTIVTSRRALGLDAATLTLAPMTTSDATAFLNRQAAGEFDPEATLAVADLCGGLPLALKIVCSRLHSRPAWTLGDLAARLRESADPVAELSVGNRRLRTTFDLSVDALDPVARRVFGVLGQGGDRFTSRSVAELGGLPEPEVAAALDRLAAEHLVVPGAAGEFGVHRLLHAHARGRSART